MQERQCSIYVPQTTPHNVRSECTETTRYIATYPSQLLQVVEVEEFDTVGASWDGHHGGGQGVAVDTNREIATEDVSID